jgi:hypothetical protein
MLSASRPSWSVRQPTFLKQIREKDLRPRQFASQGQGRSGHHPQAGDVVAGNRGPRNAKTRRSGSCTQPPKRLGACLGHTRFPSSHHLMGLPIPPSHAASVKPPDNVAAPS